MRSSLRPRRSPRAAARALAGALLVVLSSLGGVKLARALPRLGTDRPEVALKDAWDRTMLLSRFRGMPTLLLYEDKDSTAMNEPLKAELARFARVERYRRAVALVPVADVTGYDYWPVRGFVKDAIQDESHKQGAIIYCDWDGRIRGALGLESATSNVVLFDREGKVVFASSGKLSAERQDQLLALLQRLVPAAG